MGKETKCALKRCCSCRKWFRPKACAARIQKSCCGECRCKRRRYLAKARREEHLHDYRVDERERQRRCRRNRRQAALETRKTDPPVGPVSRAGLSVEVSYLQQVILENVDKQFEVSRATLVRQLRILFRESGSDRGQERV